MQKKLYVYGIKNMVQDNESSTYKDYEEKSINGLNRTKHLFFNHFFIVNYCPQRKNISYLYAFCY